MKCLINNSQMTCLCYYFIEMRYYHQTKIDGDIVSMEILDLGTHVSTYMPPYSLGCFGWAKFPS